MYIAYIFQLLTFGGMMATLALSNNWIMFAPSNTAFQSLPNHQKREISSDPKVAKEYARFVNYEMLWNTVSHKILIKKRAI